MARTVFILLVFALATPLAAQATLPDPMAEVPRGNLIIRVEDATSDWEVLPVAIRKAGRLVADRTNDLKLSTERWQRTGLAKRYRTDKWRENFDKFLGKAPEADGAFFEFTPYKPRQPLSQLIEDITPPGARGRILRVAANKVTIKGYPQTWVDIYNKYVSQLEGDLRRQGVIRWEETHRELIANLSETKDGFSAEERNDFAEFYQSQFVYVRDKDPTNPEIYETLANYHSARNNLDAELSVYLDALDNGVASPKREDFSLRIGRAYVKRLSLHREALKYLKLAEVYGEARYLHAYCLVELKRYDEAKTDLTALISALESTAADTDPPFPEFAGAKAEDIARAYLLLAETHFTQRNFPAALTTLNKIPNTSKFYENGQVLFAAMLLHRGEADDPQKARERLEPLTVMNTAKKLAAASSQPGGSVVYELNPLMARALVIYVQCDQQFRMVVPAGQTPPEANQQSLAMLEAAKAVDPLSAEPYLAEGRLRRNLGNFPAALATFARGLEVNPRDERLNYAIADLQFKAGVLAVAKDHLTRCIKFAPRFHPALVMLAEISVLEADKLRGDLLARRASGESVDIAAELVPRLKEAAAFFTAALEIQPQQPRVQLAVANLYIQLADLAPATIAVRADALEVRRTYLSRARDISNTLIRALKDFASQGAGRTRTPEQIALAPSPECLNVNAFANYSLGDYGAARRALEEHVAIIAGSDAMAYFADPASLSDYRTSLALAYARDWLRAIRENERQRVEREEFAQDSTPDYYGVWEIRKPPKPDVGFRDATKIVGGKLVLGVDQRDGKAISRLAVRKKHSTLSTFKAEFVARGDAGFHRGIHLTRLSNNTGVAGWAPESTIMLGVDPAGRIYWEVRKFQLDNEAQPEKFIEGGLVDIAAYNGPIGATERLTLGLRRRANKEGSAFEMVAIINGAQVVLLIADQDVLNNADLDSEGIALDCGFFARALTGVKGSVQVERAEFVFDSNLNNIEGG
ncbi:MAG: tetratricopeptide repeat protein [Planctomycetes bacterium]|nr:tetratricopeptide repeat protein [Planctomycetota bacterium]